MRLGGAGTAYAAGWALVKSIPEPLSSRAFRLAADLAYRRRNAGVRRLAANLRRVAPAADLDSLVRQAMRSYARYWLETFRLPVMDKAHVAARVRVHDVETFDAAVDQGRGVVLALPHMGNYDVAGIWLVDHGHPFTTVAERLKPVALFERFVAYRESLGMEVLAVGPGETPSLPTMRERLQAGRVICLVADRDLGESGVGVEFFGERTRMPSGPAFLAATTGAALVPVGLWFEGRDWGLRFHPPIDVHGPGRLRERVVRGTQVLADAFAEDIAAHPQDWHMLQPMWPAERVPAPA
ncbi:MAG TPA: phosphatidylinositol mannoside acyltransferase [Mycobacteriales bacterium]|nr:phosphatidylinositol mannoside acyltransferase [Mycobacteriales bacterium]